MARRGEMRMEGKMMEGNERRTFRKIQRNKIINLSLT
jgi:hypothetical protein